VTFPSPSDPVSESGPSLSGAYYAERPRLVIKLSPPYVTRALLAINVIVFVAMIVVGWLRFGTVRGTEDMRVLVLFGAKVNELVAAGETWRLLSAMFIHIGVLHLLFNLYALNALGPLVEGYYGHLRFAAIYLLGGLFGSLASYAFSPAPSAGASGAIFGLAGATTVYFLRYRENFGARGRAILQNMLLVIGINLAFGMFSPGIDNWGHLGGLVGGAALAWGLQPKYRTPVVVTPGVNTLEEEGRHFLHVTWVLLGGALWYMGLVWATQRLLAG
jgi:rhomboid protease GluP